MSYQSRQVVRQVEEAGKLLQQREVLVHILRKAQSRVCDDVVQRNSCLLSLFHLSVNKVRDLEGDVLVLLHHRL